MIIVVVIFYFKKGYTISTLLMTTHMTFEDAIIRTSLIIINAINKLVYTSLHLLSRKCDVPNTLLINVETT